MKNTYKYSCKVKVNDEDTLKELYEYLANILITINDKRWLSYYLYCEGEGYAVLTRSDVENNFSNIINCGTDVELFKRLVVIKSEEDDFDFALYNLNKAYEK